MIKKSLLIHGLFLCQIILNFNIRVNKIILNIVKLNMKNGLI